MASLQNNDRYDMLCKAIRKKNKVRARHLILHSVRVNDSASKNNTPLHLAITHFEDVEILTMLLDRGADIYAENHYELKPLDIAIHSNKTEAALLLIEKGALIGENFNALLCRTLELNNPIIFKTVINNRTQSDQSIDYKTLFNNAIYRGCAKILEYILPNCRFLEPSDRYIPQNLVVKFHRGYKNCVDVLLKYNFTVHPNSYQDENFIFRAVERGYVPIVTQLLEWGIDVNMTHSVTGTSLLQIACLEKNHEIIENLLKYNASLTPKEKIPHWNDSHGQSFFFIAATNSDPVTARLLLKYGAKITNDQTYFHITGIAVHANCEEIVRILLDHGVDVNFNNSDGKSLFDPCVRDGLADSRYTIAKLLLERGAISQIQAPGNSFLYEAVNNGHHRIAQLFLNNDADVQFVNPAGDTLLHKAIEKNFDVVFIKALLQRNVPVDAVNDKMFTPLLLACQTRSRNQLEIIKALLQYHANINYTLSNVDTCFPPGLKSHILAINLACYADGQTPLHFICMHQSDFTRIIIKLFLQLNANIEAKDQKGCTPLLVACKTSNDTAIKCLLEHHADINCTDSENLTALWIAVRHSTYNSGVVKILVQHKVDVNHIDKQGNSIIHEIVARNRGEFLKILARSHVNFNSFDKEGNTPLYLAVNTNCYIMENLIKYGADINYLDKDNQTPLQKYTNKLFIPNTHWVTCDKIPSFFTTQVLKLNIAGLYVNEKNLQIIFDHSDECEICKQEGSDYKNNILQFEMECKKEIEKMKMERIGIDNMTFYNLLQKNIYSLRRYIKNEKMQQILDLEIYDEMFPLYMDVIRSRFRDATPFSTLMNLAKKHFWMTVHQRMPEDCIDRLFSYLHIQEVMNFIQAVEPINISFYLNNSYKFE